MGENVSLAVSENKVAESKATLLLEYIKNIDNLKCPFHRFVIISTDCKVTLSKNNCNDI